MTEIEPELQSQVDALLLEQGAFAPLELLFSTGRLLYGDYESWRRREIEILDSVLMGNAANVRAELERAVAYARGLGLTEQLLELQAWGAGGGSIHGAPLRISTDSRLQQLIGARYVRVQSAPQMDLFFDNPLVALTNGILHALAHRNAAEAARQLDQLYARAPNHPELPAFDQLLAALGRMDQIVDDIRQELAFARQVTPTAKRLLGTQARDLTTPLWRRLATALGGRPYADEEPELHSSFALAQAHDWAGVPDSVRSVPQWWRHPALSLRLVESACQRRQRIEALAAWCQFCWRAPEAVEPALAALRQPELSSLWLRFLDDAAAVEDDDEPVLSAAEFPAWLLLREPGLAGYLPIDLSAGDAPGEDVYRCVHRWVHARRAQRHADEIALRKELRELRPALFQLLKRSVE